MIFTNYGLSKNSQNYQADIPSLDYYLQKNAPSYSPSDNSKSYSGSVYVPSLDYTLSDPSKNGSSGSDIADVITGDKLRFLGASASHLKSQIDERSKITG